ncbi:MAG: TonB family protein [Candidatus Gastranaerophilales bacterium]|nr:TonB family protein [Candidatus Gastranaerophilales bacterium]
MYRCTECHKEYTNCPDFCDCGNDTFEEIENNYYEEEQLRQAPSQKRKLSPEEKKEIAKEKLEKKKSLIALAVIFVLCIVVFIIPPHKKPKMEKVKAKMTQEQMNIPSVDTYWNDALPSAFKQKDTIANLPLLNSKFGSISPVLKEYLGQIGASFDKKWDKSIIQGYGECKAEFTINKEGNLATSKIVTSSNNESLDDSVLLVFSNLNSFQIPPDDYKGERIYITFKVNENGSSSIKYPSR